VLWHCQYHIVWISKYRYKVLRGKIGEVRKTIIIQSERLGCEILELNIQVDHVHLLIKVPPKVSISSLMGVMKGKSAIRVFSKFPELRKKGSQKTGVKSHITTKINYTGFYVKTFENRICWCAVSYHFER